jgi:hypothetical protein
MGNEQIDCPLETVRTHARRDDAFGMERRPLRFEQ